MHLKSVQRYKVLLSDIYHPDAAYLGQQAFGDPWLFFEAKRGSTSKKKFGKHLST
jgi:hypothetical protein